MNAKTLILLIAMTLMIAPLSAQDKLSEEEIQGIVEKMENEWRFALPMVRWMEDQSSFDYYIGSVHERCPDELEDVLEMAEDCYKESRQVLMVEKQIYRKPGSEKWEASLEKYFKDTDRAREKFATAHRNVEMYEKMAKMFPPIIEGMRRICADIGIRLCGEAAVTKEQVDEIRKLLIDGEVYKMPRYHDLPVILLDGPGSSVSVRFTDGEYMCNSLPPSDWGGKNIIAVYNYLRALHPKK